MFPGGPPGAGLLLLRAAIGLQFLIDGSRLALASLTLGPATAITALLMIIIGLSFVIGFFTSAVGAFAAAAAVSLHFWTIPATGFLLPGSLSNAYVIVIASALALLGPGAISVDARLFGRRGIIIPRSLP